MLAIKYDPQTWSDYVGHKPHVKVIREKFLEQNQPPYALTLSGLTGTGKTSLVKLFIKSLLCKNREYGKSDPCGHCSVCKSDPRLSSGLNNVWWVQDGNGETIGSQFKSIYNEAYSPPVGMAEEQRDWKVFVFDEIQTLSKTYIQKLFLLPEIEQLRRVSKLIFIFITMAEDKIDPDIYRPLAGRSHVMYFHPLEDKDIASAILKHYPIPKESLKLILRAARGSLRDAWSFVQQCQDYDPYFTEAAVAQQLNFATQKLRQELWLRLENPWNTGGIPNLRKFVSFLETRCSPIKLVQQLSDDLDDSYSYSNFEEILVLQQFLLKYQTSKGYCRLWDVLKIFMNKKLVNTELISPEPQSGLEMLEPLLTNYD